jgi:molybdopterin molybdotransferase
MALLAVEEALRRLLAGAAPLETETIDPLAANGRVLAAPLTATLTQPPFDASAMDGYAVRARDVATVPVRLASRAKRQPAAAGWRGRQRRGPTTGAPVPAGADAIVIQENCDRDGDIVIVREGTADHSHVRARGIDFRAGDRLLAAGTRLGPRQVTLAAAMGHGRLPVHRRPVVAILASGDELVLPGEPPQADQIVCRTPYGVAARCSAPAAIDLRHRQGQPRPIERHLAAAAGADIPITIGGASVGDHDPIAPALQANTADFLKIAMRPGKDDVRRLGATWMFGRRNRCPR